MSRLAGPWIAFLLAAGLCHPGCRHAPATHETEKTAVPAATPAPVVPARVYKKGEIFRYRLRRLVRDNGGPWQGAIGISEHRVVEGEKGFAEQVRWVEYFEETEDRSDLARKVAPAEVSLDPQVPLELARPVDVPEMMGMVTDLFTFYVSVSRAAGADKLREVGESVTNPEIIRGDWSDGKQVLVGQDCLELTLRLLLVTDDRVRLEAAYRAPDESCMELEAPFAAQPETGEPPYNFKMIRSMGPGRRVVVWGHERFTVTASLSRKSGHLLSASMDNHLDWHMKMCTDEKMTTCTNLPPLHKQRALDLTALHVRPSSEKTPGPSGPPLPYVVTKKWTDRTGIVLGAVRELRAREKEYLASKHKGFYLQSLGTLESFLGNYDAALARFEQLQPAPAKNENDEPAVQLTGYEVENAFFAIVREADKHRAVFINEAHHVPRHRALTRRLLVALYQKGYRYFAAETLAESGDEIAARGYPSARLTGYYTGDPVYADLVRTALRLGYRVVAYEHFEPCQPDPENPSACQNQRERGQARNLKERVFDQDPDAKLLVHAGYGHIAKKGLGSWVPMGAAFTELTGLDPLTIDQTGMGPSLSKRYGIEAPSVLAKPDGGWFTRPPHYVDMQVIHPPVESVAGRPGWLRLDGARRPIPVPAGICRDVRPCLVQAFLASEGDDAAPIDQLEVSKAHHGRSLMLPAEPVRVRALDVMGKPLEETRIEP